MVHHNKQIRTYFFLKVRSDFLFVMKSPVEYSGRFYTPIPEIGNHRSDMKETAIPF